MRNIFKSVMVVAMATLLSAPLFAQDAQQLKKERIQASYMITFGRLPSSGELNHWMGRENLSLPQLVNNHSQYLQGDANEKRQVIIRAFKSAYGYSPSEDNIRQNMSSRSNYTQLMNNHTAYLKSNAAAWNDVVGKAYANVCRRTPTAADKKSWPHSSARPYYLLAAIVEKWHKESSHNSRHAVLKSSNHLTMVVVSNTVAGEMAGLIGPAGGNVIAAGGGNVIAAGGGNVIAAGGGNVIAAGGGN